MRDAMRQTRLLIGLNGNQQVLLKFYTITWGRLALPASGSQSHLAARARAIVNYSTRGGILSDYSPVGLLVFLGFATKLNSVLAN